MQGWQLPVSMRSLQRAAPAHNFSLLSLLPVNDGVPGFILLVRQQDEGGIKSGMASALRESPEGVSLYCSLSHKI